MAVLRNVPQPAREQELQPLGCLQSGVWSSGHGLDKSGDGGRGHVWSSPQRGSGTEAMTEKVARRV